MDEQWLETYVKPVAKPSGYEHYCDNMYKHILLKLGNLPMNELRTAVVQQFLNGEALRGNLRTGGPLSAKNAADTDYSQVSCGGYFLSEC